MRKALLRIPHNTGSGVIYGITEEKKLRTFSNKFTSTIDFTDDDTVAQIECDVSVVKNIFVNSGNILVIYKSLQINFGTNVWHNGCGVGLSLYSFSYVRNWSIYHTLYIKSEMASLIL